MLGVSINVSRSLATLTGTLHTREDLVALMEERRIGQSAEEEDKSVVELTAEIITKIFTTCLNDRSSARFAQPTGKKTAVYKLANLVLKLLFMSQKTRPAQQLFTQLATLSPPLRYYPASQRVTYLYYLGRFNFINSHFLRAAAALQSAYVQTSPSFTSHRTKILIYLIPANLLVGRLPSQTLLSRPEATQLAPIFEPLGYAMRLGSFVLLSQVIAEHEPFFFAHGLLFALTTRLKPIIWRSLARRTFQLTWSPNEGPGTMEQDGPRRAATLDLADLVATATYQQRILEGYIPVPGSQVLLSRPHPKPPGINPVFMRAVANAAFSGSQTTSTLVAPAGGKPKMLRPLEGVLNGNLPVTSEHVEWIVAGLVQSGWMKGYMAHAQGKFAVSGVKQKNGNAVAAGWPTVWEVVNEGRPMAKVTVPGWIVEES